MPNRTSRFARSRLGILATAVTLFASLSGCGLLSGEEDSGSDGASGNAKLEKATINVGVLPVVDVAPLYLAIEKGYFKDEGLNVKVQVLPSGPASIQALVGKDIDIAFASYPAPITAQGQGAGDFKFVAEALAAKPGHMTVVAPQGSSLTKPEEMPGKKIAITAPKSFTDLAPMAILESKGIPFDTIQWVPMAFPDMIGAMQKGDVDGAVVVSPWPTIAEKQLGARVIFDAASGPTGEMPMSGWTALGGEGNLVDSSPNTVAAFQRGLAKAQAEAQKDRSIVEPILVKYAKVDKSIASLMTIATFSTSLDPKRVQRVADLLYHFHVTADRVDVSKMVVAAPADEG